MILALARPTISLGPLGGLPTRVRESRRTAVPPIDSPWSPTFISWIAAVRHALRRLTRRSSMVSVPAWHEAYGLPIPSPAELTEHRKTAKAAKQEEADRTVALLKTGPAGVKEFNRRPIAERAKTDLRKADLDGCYLSGIEFTLGARLDEARLVGAKLTKAYLVGCKCGDAD